MLESDWFDNWFADIESKAAVEEMVWIVTHELAFAIYDEYLRKTFSEEYLREHLLPSPDDEDVYDLDEFFKQSESRRREVRHLRDGILHYEVVRVGWQHFRKNSKRIETRGWVVDPSWLEIALHVANAIHAEELFGHLSTLEIYLNKPEAKEWKEELLFTLEADRQRYLHGDDSDMNEKNLIEQAIEISGVFSSSFNSTTYAPFGLMDHTHKSRSYPESGWNRRDVIDKQTAMAMAKRREKVRIHDYCRVIFDAGRWYCMGEAERVEPKKIAESVKEDPILRLRAALDEMTGALPHLFDPGKDKHYIMAEHQIEQLGDFEVRAIDLLSIMSLWLEDGGKEAVEALENSSTFRNHQDIMVHLSQALVLMAAGGEPARNDTGLALVSAISSVDSRILHTLAHHSCPVVRSAVLHNINVNEKTFMLLSLDPNEEVRAKALANRGATPNSRETSFAYIDYKCGCYSIDENETASYSEFREYLEKNSLRLPRKFQTIKNIYKFGSGHWATIPYPTPWEDYWFQPRNSETLDWGTIEYFKHFPEEQFAITYAGHGINSYGLNLRIVYGEVAILGQVGWGGAYGDPEKDKQSWSDMVFLIDQVLDKVKPRIKETQVKYILGLSNFRGDLFMQDTDGNWIREERTTNLELISKLVGMLSS